MALLERGGYLVNAVMACDGCHTPRGAGGFDMAGAFPAARRSGTSRHTSCAAPTSRPTAKPASARWSADDIKRLMTDGRAAERRAGRAADAVSVLQDPDARATSMRWWPTSSRCRRCATRCRRRSTRPRCTPNSFPAPRSRSARQMLKDPVKRGFYLATIAHCMECHARTAGRQAGLRELAGARAATSSRRRRAR